MKRTRRLTSSMVPALSGSVHHPTVSDIDSVPALPVEVGFGGHLVATVGVLDPTAELSVIHHSLIDALPKSPVVAEKALIRLADSFETAKEVKIYRLDVRLHGESAHQTLAFQAVPTAATNLQRQQLILGRRGLLEWLKLELDFPRRTITLSLSKSSYGDYPSLSQAIPSLDSILDAFRQDRVGSGIMMLVWELDRFVDMYARSQADLKAKERERPHTLSFADKLRVVSQVLPLPSIANATETLVMSRNEAAHRGTIDADPTDVLAAAESIISALMGAGDERDVPNKGMESDE